MCSKLLFLEELVYVRLKRVTLGIVLHVLTMLTKVMCTLKVAFSMKEIEEKLNLKFNSIEIIEGV